MKPKIVIITTPNREYNVLFENFEGPFRHWDHKFEWTRSEFQNWVQTCIIDKYPDYIVERFDGLGKDLFRNGWNAQFFRILKGTGSLYLPKIQLSSFNLKNASLRMSKVRTWSTLICQS
jgi:hypothetical protein